MSYSILSDAWVKLEQMCAGVYSRVASVAGAVEAEDGSDKSGILIYFISFLLLVMVVLLSPDRIPEAVFSQRAEVGVFEKLQDFIRFVRKLIPSLG